MTFLEFIMHTDIVMSMIEHYQDNINNDVYEDANVLKTMTLEDLYKEYILLENNS